MDKATVTGKGQVTLPQRIRERLGIETGDKLLFDIEGDELRVRVVHGRKIDSLFASLPGVEAYAGDEAERQAIREGFACPEQ
jgi:antitoxin PrlF